MFLFARCSVATLLVAILLVLAAPAWAQSAKQNEFCPVMPSKPALPDFEMKFRGETIQFCCENCRQLFLKDPAAYLSQLPQFEANPAALEEDLETADSLLKDLDTQKTSQHLFVVTSSAAALLVLWWLVRGVFRRRGWRLGVRPLLAELGICLLLGVIAAMYFRVRSLDHEVHQAQLKDLLHFATFYDFGDPPVPAKPPVPKRLHATFYRGNDERSPRLFNGGNYRTCTFHVALCDNEGRELKYGNEGSSPLFIRLQIERGPHTPDFFWHADNMRKYFLTRQVDPFIGSTGPIADRVNLNTDEPMQRWSAMFPVDGDAGAAKRGGIIYVCEQFATEKQMVGARYHYAIQYDLDLAGGRIGERSDLWMGALYRTRKVLQWRLPLHEWFSHEPIPVLPRPMANDPKLLGIGDYVRSPEAH
jgi:YHS domain-containing protein